MNSSMPNAPLFSEQGETLPPPYHQFEVHDGFKSPPVFQMPIQQQPQQSNLSPNGWMTMPQGAQVCPPGLEYLTMIDQLLVHQKVELLEIFTGFETENKYTIKNSLGQNVYWAVEESNCCTRQICGPSRPFEMEIKDASGYTVIHLSRPLKCQCCLCACCLQVLEVYSPPGTLIGSIEQNCSILRPDLSIKNAAGDTIFKIRGPICRIACCGDINFKVNTLNCEEIGKISKQWSGLAREMFTDADNFGITFPMNLDVKVKALMLGACFLIDFMYFETKQNDNQLL